MLKKKYSRRILIILSVVILLIALISVSINLFHPMQLSGNSIFPELNSGETFITNPIKTSFATGDIIVYKSGNLHYVGRILALPNQEFFSASGHLYANGKLLSDKYFPLHNIYYPLLVNDLGVSEEKIMDYQKETVPANTYFILDSGLDPESTISYIHFRNWFSV